MAKFEDINPDDGLAQIGPKGSLFAGMQDDRDPGRWAARASVGELDAAIAECEGAIKKWEDLDRPGQVMRCREWFDVFRNERKKR